MTYEAALVFIFAMVVTGGVAVVIAGMRHRAKELEMAHRERLAMIERGMAPPVAGDRVVEVIHDRPAPNRRMLSIGVTTIAFGLALGMIIGFAGDQPDVATGVGGAIVFIGTAFVVNALLATGRVAPAPPIPPPSFRTRPDANRSVDPNPPE